MNTRNSNQIDRLEQRMEDGFSSLRRESRDDFRFLLGAILGMLMTAMLGIVVATLLQLG